jgi:mannose-6-phosphate isomerase
VAAERARTHVVPKPWGVIELGRWSDARHDGKAIGEIWYERSDQGSAECSLLLKLLFTSQPLSIQVHPGDAFAHSLALPRGKSEAWYILSATPDAKVALGLKEPVSSQQLREAVENGSIADLVVWFPVSAGDVIFVPAGTIHAIGAGLVLAELQQRSDTTFRLFDYGRARELHVENAVEVATKGPADVPARPTQLTDERAILVSCPHFSFEKIELPSNSEWSLSAERETWLLVLGGHARIGSIDVVAGDAVYAQSDRVEIRAGATGLVCLLANTSAIPIADLLWEAGRPDIIGEAPPLAVVLPAPATQPNAAALDEFRDTTR